MHSRWTKIIAAPESEKVHKLLEPLGMSSTAFSVEQIKAMSNCIASHRLDIEKRVGVGAIAMFSEVETLLHKDAGPSGTILFLSRTLSLLFIILTLLNAAARFESAMQYAVKATPNVHNDQQEQNVAKGPIAFAKKVKRKHDAGQEGAYKAGVVQVSTQDLAIYTEVEQLNPA